MSEKLTRTEYILLLIVVAVIAAAATGFGVYYFQQRQDAEPRGNSIGVIVPNADELPPLDYTLYFFALTEGVLVPEIREGPAAPATEDRVRLAVAELARGPETAGLVSTVTTGLSLRAVYLEPDRNLAHVDLAAPLLDTNNPTPLEAWGAIYSVVNTVCALSEDIERVQLLRGGSPMEEPLGGWDLTAPFEPESAWVRHEDPLP